MSSRMIEKRFVDGVLLYLAGSVLVHSVGIMLVDVLCILGGFIIALLWLKFYIACQVCNCTNSDPLWKYPVLIFNHVIAANPKSIYIETTNFLSYLQK